MKRTQVVVTALQIPDPRPERIVGEDSVKAATALCRELEHILALDGYPAARDIVYDPGYGYIVGADVHGIYIRCRYIPFYVKCCRTSAASEVYHFLARSDVEQLLCQQAYTGGRGVDVACLGLRGNCAKCICRITAQKLAQSVYA